MTQKLSFLSSFRWQLILSLGVTILATLGFQFYIFWSTSHLGEALDEQPVTVAQVEAVDQQLVDLSQASFFFLAFTAVGMSGGLIYLIFVLNNSFRQILSGIQAVEAGNLGQRIYLQSDNEFGVIARFFNQATAHVEEIVLSRTHELQAERNKLAVILTGVSDAVMAVDLERRVISFNRAAEKLTGMTAEQAIGQPIDHIIRLWDTETEVKAEYYCPIQDGDFEGVLFSKDKMEMQVVGTVSTKEIWVKLSVGKIKESHLVNLGAILTFHDLTEEHELEHMKLDFVSIAAHELRTPLTIMRGYLSFLGRSDTISKLSEKEQSYIKKSTLSGLELYKLIENILTVSRIEQRQMVLQTQPVDIEELVIKVKEELFPLAEAKKLEIIFNRPQPKLPPVLADEARIHEVLTNLVGNAISYTSKGRVTITVKIENEQILTIIQDTGQGIPPDAMPKLFTKFFRVQGLLQAGSKGTGLGLYIAKNIVTAHGGQIWADSQLGQGSTFYFSLPLAKVR